MESNLNYIETLKKTIMDLRQMKSFCENPLVIKKGKGCKIADINGKTYIDGISGIYTANVGHGNEYILSAMKKQMNKINFVAPLHAIADTTLEYVERLIDITPEGLNVIKLLSGGSEATETAIKFIRQYFRQTGKPQKYKIISNYKGFHGATFGAMSATGLGGPRKTVFGPFLEGFVHIPPPTCFRCSYGMEYPGCDILCGKMLETFIEGEGEESVGAFIIEPIGNTGGIVTPPKEYFSIIREICDKHNVLLIYDEIITGMGRTGSWFAAQTFGVTPDIICMGKGVGGGYVPLSAVAFREELYYEAFWGEPGENLQFAHGHTFGGNPLAAAAGLAVINFIDDNDCIVNGKRAGERIRKILEEENRSLEIFGDIRGKGALIGVEFVKSQRTKEPFPTESQFGKNVEKRLIEKGLILRCDPNWIAFGPPLIITDSEVDEMMEIFIEAVRKEVAHAGV